MPITLPTPQPISHVEADTFEITSFTVDTLTAKLTVRVRYGLRQPNGSVQWIDERGGVTAYAPYASLLPDGAKSFYQNTKVQVYKAAEDMGLIPRGGVAT